MNAKSLLNHCNGSVEIIVFQKNNMTNYDNTHSKTNCNVIAILINSSLESVKKLKANYIYIILFFSIFRNYNT